MLSEVRCCVNGICSVKMVPKGKVLLLTRLLLPSVLFWKIPNVIQKAKTWLWHRLGDWPWGLTGSCWGKCASGWGITASDWHTAGRSPEDTEPFREEIKGQIQVEFKNRSTLKTSARELLKNKLNMTWTRVNFKPFYNKVMDFKLHYTQKKMFPIEAEAFVT